MKTCIHLYGCSKNLVPVSPILEYAIKEKVEHYKEGSIIEKGEGCPKVREEELEIRDKDFDDYVRGFSNLSVGVVNGKKLPHKAILLISIMNLIENGIVAENQIGLDKTIALAFASTWRKYYGDVKPPSVWTPFWYLKSEAFWHFEPKENDEELLQGLLKFAGHPSIGQMRLVIKHAYLDDALFVFFRTDDSRHSLKKILEITYIEEYVY